MVIAKEVGEIRVAASEVVVYQAVSELFLPNGSVVQPGEEVDSKLLRRDVEDLLKNGHIVPVGEDPKVKPPPQGVVEIDLQVPGGVVEQIDEATEGDQNSEPEVPSDDPVVPVEVKEVTDNADV